ncbi:ROK family transcriptional regulator [Notoacmeibacter ruber]|uniref:ROK family transcriptional regulator n=1 Tax=Notoacmeibacter ruber TaxID=2670375 RepID=A0A3L7J8S6_9HYPH|nr:ROK family transcriptional regulator [Notoacmeibacter ruber]RLQ87137.1 ROK family transcriptional regulator [Notoacmeibacter ruber]
MARRTMATRPDDMRRMNRIRLLATLRACGGTSRHALSHETGLSAATVSTITAELIEEGLIGIGESTTGATSRGRPRVTLKPAADVGILACVAFRYNQAIVSLVDYAGEQVAHLRSDLDTRSLDKDGLYSALEALIRRAMAEGPVDAPPLRRITLGMQGIVDLEGRTLLWSPALTFHEAPLADALEERFDVPARLYNDCDLMAEALRKQPFRKGLKDFAAILVASGVGMGLHLRGQLVNGLKSSGTEFGHIPVHPGGALCRCGHRGCVEAYAGGYAMARRAAGLHGSDSPVDIGAVSDLSTLVSKADAGDIHARAAIDEAGEALGLGLASLFTLVDPFPIVLVGQHDELFERMTTPLRRTLAATRAGQAIAESLPISFSPDPVPLTLAGAALSGLTALDEMLANNLHLVREPGGGKAA